MARIEVNHADLRTVASAINAYCTKQDSEMRSADAEVNAMLSKDWIGDDAHAFGSKWINVNASDSTAIKFRKNLKNYGETIAACAELYRNAQIDAYNSANWLPKWLVW